MQIDAKKFFRGCVRIDPRIEAKCDEIDRAKAMAERVTASYSDEPRGGGGPTSRVENAVIRYIDLEQRLQGEIDCAMAYRDFAKDVISKIADDRYRDVLDWRYFAQWQWPQISIQFGDVGKQYIFKLHGRALKAAQRILDTSPASGVIQNYYLKLYPPERM
jgi:hypothetical protein